MTLIAYDGFDSCANFTDLQNRWNFETYIEPDQDLALSFDVGRNGVGKSMKWTSLGVRCHRGVPNLATVIVGAALKFVGDDTGISSDYRIFEFWDLSNRHSSVTLDFNTRQLKVQNSNNTVLGSSVQTMRDGNWYYIECKCTVSDSIAAGEYQVLVNGEVWIDLPATTDTKNNSGRPSVSSVHLGGHTGSGTYRSNRPQWDDVYILDPLTGVAPYNDFLGDCRADTIRPNGNGTTSDFVGNDADSVDNYLLVDEVDPDYATTYLTSSTPGDLDLFAMESLPITPLTILCVQPVSICRKDDAGDRIAKHVVRTGATNYTHPDGIYPSDKEFLGFESKWELNPNTGIAWVEADIDALEAGITIDS